MYIRLHVTIIKYYHLYASALLIMCVLFDGLLNICTHYMAYNIMIMVYGWVQRHNITEPSLYRTK